MVTDLHTSILASPIAPEDIRVGDYVALMNETNQIVLRNCDGDSFPQSSPRLSVVSVRTVADFPRVLRVLGLALPFVLVEDAHGDRSLVTVRLNELARLPAGVGELALRDLDRRRRKEAAKRRADAARRRHARDRPGALGADGAD